VNGSVWSGAAVSVAAALVVVVLVIGLVAASWEVEAPFVPEAADEWVRWDVVADAVEVAVEVTADVVLVCEVSVGAAPAAEAGQPVAGAGMMSPSAAL